MLGIREFKKIYKTITIGDNFYFNSIGANTKVIDYVRTLIKNKEITPIKEEVEKVIYKDCYDKVYNGDIIMPQMNYTKLK
jgi:hypothetical protein